MRRLSCPDCGTKHCKICEARRCKCPPKKMEIVTYCRCSRKDIMEFIFKNKARQEFREHKKTTELKDGLPIIDMSKLLDKVRDLFMEGGINPLLEKGEEDLLEAAKRQEREDKEVEKDYAVDPQTTNLHILDGSIHSFTYKDGEQSVSLNLYIDDDDDQCNGMQDMLEVFAWLMDEGTSKSITLERDEDGLLRLTINVVRKWQTGLSDSDEEE